MNISPENLNSWVKIAEERNRNYGIELSERKKNEEKIRKPQRPIGKD